jgi:hypothetical protein
VTNAPIANTENTNSPVSGQQQQSIASFSMPFYPYPKPLYPSYANTTTSTLQNLVIKPVTFDDKFTKNGIFSPDRKL